MQRTALHTVAALATILGLSGLSLFVGVDHLSLSGLLGGQGHEQLVLVVSRIPRTLAIVLVGTSTSIAGLIFQMLARNRFVEPATAGTTESAGLGLILAMLLFPAAALAVKMLLATLVALAGTGLFLLLLRRLPPSEPLLVPLVGLMLGGVIGSVTLFVAYQADLLQYLGTWMTGEFSGVLQGRYELLWLTGALALLAWITADRFTILGLGQDTATALGLNFRQVQALGLVIVAGITAVTLVTVGAIPFLGLVVPNIVSRLVGDNLRAAVPWAAALGTGLLMVSDLLGRTINAPYEVPVGTVFGIVGAVVFLWLLLGRPARARG